MYSSNSVYFLCITVHAVKKLFNNSINNFSINNYQPGALEYVGSITRSLATRSAEYAGVSVNTVVPLSQPRQPYQSHIREHLFSCGVPQIALDHFEIIGMRNNNILELRILESLHIAKIKPSLNCRAGQR